MSMYCQNCGKELNESAAYCTECGIPISKQPTKENIAPTQQSNANTRPADDSSEKIASTGAFFGMQFLFALPFIGWIVCIVMAFSDINPNLKNYARSKLIWIVIEFIMTIALLSWMHRIADAAVRFISAGAGGDFESVAELIRYILYLLS